MLRSGFGVAPNSPLCPPFCEVLLSLEFDRPLASHHRWYLELVDRQGGRRGVHVLDLNVPHCGNSPTGLNLSPVQRWHAPHGRGVNMLCHDVFLRSDAPQAVWPRRVLAIGALLEVKARDELALSGLQFAPYSVQPAKTGATLNRLDYHILHNVVRQEFALTRPARL